MNDRKHLTMLEVDKLLTATKGSRNEVRDRRLLLLMFRQGLRVSEACRLQLSQVDTESRVLHVARLKKGLSTTHPIRPDEIKAIKAWLVVRAKMKLDTDAFFFSESRRPLSRVTAWAAIRKYGELAELPLPAPPTHVTPWLRFRLSRSRRGYTAYSGLSRSQEDSAHRHLHGEQSGTV